MVMVAALLCGCGGDSSPVVVPSLPQKTAAEVAAERQADADRRFKGDAEVHAEMHVHKALVQHRGDSMPENWKERGEMIRREGDFAMVLVRTGIKEGMLSPLVTVQAYLVSVHMNMPGDKVFLSAAQRCGDPPSPAVIAMMMVENKWPSAMETLSAPTSKKKRRNADQDE